MKANVKAQLGFSGGTGESADDLDVQSAAH
jgi:hypothetical protein